MTTAAKVISIVTLKDLIAYLEEKPEMAEHLATVRALTAKVWCMVESPGGDMPPGFLQLSGDQRPAGVKIIRRTIFKLAANKTRQHASQKCQQLAGQQRLIDGCNLRPRIFFSHDLAQLNLDTLKRLVNPPLGTILFEHQRMAGPEFASAGDYAHQTQESAAQSDAGAPTCLFHL